MQRDIQIKKYYIEVLPVGDISKEVIDYTLKAVEKRFGLPAKAGQAILILADAFNPRRRQYDASIILEKISRLRSADAAKALGIIEGDLFSKGLNYVFGQAKLGGCCGIISLTRLREGIEQSDGSRLFFERIEKEATHELGHTFGLRHCPNPRCVMYYSNNLADTDRKSADFCPECGLPMVLH
ncbi:MAG: archaemetzincin family Zn-dependent metalloprotease [Actinobacteria bacterium]|nr:archaemetzincin family Zn-dependent metalloprotease [Actinomycetota bacterium]